MSNEVKLGATGKFPEGKISHQGGKPTMTPVYSEFSVQFHPWNSGIRFTRKTGDNGHWIIVDQDRSRVLSMYFPGASDADIDAVVKALNKLLPTVKPLVEPFRDPEAIEL